MNELQTILADTVNRLFTDRVTQELRESAEKGVWPAGLWQQVEENGLTLPQIPEARGGGGGTWQDAHIVVSAAGRFAVPLPLAETMVGAWLLAESGLDVPTGPLSVAPVHPADRLELTRERGGWRLSGAATRVPWGRAAGHIVVTAGGQGALVPAGRATVEADVQLALLAGHTAAAGSAAANAFRAADRGDAAFEIAVAKVRTGEAAGLGAGIAHQCHGAIGFTYEHSLHFVTRRLWSWRAEFGAESHWAAEIGRDIALRGADGLWPHITSGGSRERP